MSKLLLHCSRPVVGERRLNRASSGCAGGVCAHYDLRVVLFSNELAMALASSVCAPTASILLPIVSVCCTRIEEGSGAIDSGHRPLLLLATKKSRSEGEYTRLHRYPCMWPGRRRSLDVKKRTAARGSLLVALEFATADRLSRDRCCCGLGMICQELCVLRPDGAIVESTLIDGGAERRDMPLALMGHAFGPSAHGNRPGCQLQRSGASHRNTLRCQRVARQTGIADTHGRLIAFTPLNRAHASPASAHGGERG